MPPCAGGAELRDAQRPLPAVGEAAFLAESRRLAEHSVRLDPFAERPDGLRRQFRERLFEAPVRKRAGDSRIGRRDDAQGEGDDAEIVGVRSS